MIQFFLENSKILSGNNNVPNIVVILLIGLTGFCFLGLITLAVKLSTK